MTNVSEGNMYNNVCKSVDTQGAKVRNLEVRCDILTQARKIKAGPTS